MMIKLAAEYPFWWSDNSSKDNDTPGCLLDKLLWVVAMATLMKIRTIMNIFLILIIHIII